MAKIALEVQPWVDGYDAEGGGDIGVLAIPIKDDSTIGAITLSPLLLPVLCIWFFCVPFLNPSPMYTITRTEETEHRAPHSSRNIIRVVRDEVEEQLELVSVVELGPDEF